MIVGNFHLRIEGFFIDWVQIKLCRRDFLSWDDALNLASFLGEQLRNLHLLPHPSFNSTISSTSYTLEAIPDCSKITPKWDVFIKTLNKKRESISDHVKKWYVSLCQLNGLFTFFIHLQSNIDQMANLKLMTQSNILCILVHM